MNALLLSFVLIGPDLPIKGHAVIVGRIPSRHAERIEQDRLWDDYWYSDQQYSIPNADFSDEEWSERLYRAETGRSP